MPFEFSLDAATALVSVIAIDVALSADNAVIVGMAAAGLPSEQRRKAIMVGILAAAGLRIVFAIFVVQLLNILGLLFAGGVLLLWVSWKLWRELHPAKPRPKIIVESDETLEVDYVVDGAPVHIEAHRHTEEIVEAAPPRKTLRDAVTQIIVADVSMSLDNVLAVAGAARDHQWILIGGLALSVVLMGIAASLISRLLQKHRWIAYVGLAIIFYVSLRMMWDGGLEIFRAARDGGII